MKDYFAKLKEHPGVSVAALMSVLCTLAGATNKSFVVVWHGALFGLAFSLLFWIIVLITNFNRK